MSDENPVTEQVENVATPEAKTNAASWWLSRIYGIKRKKRYKLFMALLVVRDY
jgi:hypothetical protein